MVELIKLSGWWLPSIQKFKNFLKAMVALIFIVSSSSAPAASGRPLPIAIQNFVNTVNNDPAYFGVRFEKAQEFLWAKMFARTSVEELSRSLDPSEKQTYASINRHKEELSREAQKIVKELFKGKSLSEATLDFENILAAYQKPEMIFPLEYIVVAMNQYYFGDEVTEEFKRYSTWTGQAYLGASRALMAITSVVLLVWMLKKSSRASALLSKLEANFLPAARPKQINRPDYNEVEVEKAWQKLEDLHAEQVRVAEEFQASGESVNDVLKRLETQDSVNTSSSAARSQSQLRASTRSFSKVQKSFRLAEKFNYKGARQAIRQIRNSLRFSDALKSEKGEVWVERAKGLALVGGAMGAGAGGHILWLELKKFLNVASENPSDYMSPRQMVDQSHRYWHGLMIRCSVLSLNTEMKAFQELAKEKAPTRLRTAYNDLLKKVEKIIHSQKIFRIYANLPEVDFPLPPNFTLDKNHVRLDVTFNNQRVERELACPNASVNIELGDHGQILINPTQDNTDLKNILDSLKDFENPVFAQETQEGSL